MPLIVTINTTASGAIPISLHFMSKNFSPPSSEPKPASVTTISACANASFVATILLQPCAIFAKGPQCIYAGVL